jgi:hypothetical protein
MKVTMADPYKNFLELAKKETQGIDFRVRLQQRGQGRNTGEVTDVFSVVREAVLRMGMRASLAAGTEGLPGHDAWLLPSLAAGGVCYGGAGWQRGPRDSGAAPSWGEECGKAGA